MYQNNRLNNRIPSAADVLYGQPKEPPRRDWRYTCQSKTLKRNALSTECFYAADNRLQAKIERQNGLDDEFIYQFDKDGHLLQVVRNGFLEEEYKYNKQGQRVYQKRRYNGVIDITTGDLHYNEAGQLMQAGQVSFGYDNNGALSERRDPQGLTRYCYGDDTLLDGAALPGGEKIRYEYDEESPDGMARRLKGGHLSATYRWFSVCKLEAYLDYEHSLYYSFVYHGEGWLERVKITLLRIAQPGWKSHDYLAEIVRQERRERLHKLLNSYGGGLELCCGCDQVGTPKLFTDRHGCVVKEIEFDSFGLVRDDSNPDLFIPIGFAGGLADPDTGLVRFGWRDYDPSVGRFTAPDPARDRHSPAGGLSGASLISAADKRMADAEWRRGDGDLYDYCVDDPISRIDPDGLWTRDWDESKHPRDRIGRFTYKGGGGGGGAAREITTGTPEAREATRNMYAQAGASRTDIGQGGSAAGKPLVTNEDYHRALAEAAKGHAINGRTDPNIKLPRFFMLHPLFEGMAKELDIDANFLLALSSYESGWLDDHNTSLNNLFGITNAGGPNIKFDSLESCMRTWIRIFGDRVRGSKSMEEFIANLRNANRGAYNTVNSEYDQKLIQQYNYIVKNKPNYVPAR